MKIFLFSLKKEIKLSKHCITNKRGYFKVSRIINVTPNDDYTLLIEFEYGNKILFNMKKLIKTIPYHSLQDLKCFKNIKIEDKAILWQGEENQKSRMMPVRLTVDNILFTIRG